MDEFKPLAWFAEVVRAGSFSGAARLLRVSPSAVSQQIRALERRHGVTLLHRSTRKLALTDAGARLASHCTDLIEAAQRARHQLALAQDALDGELRLTAPVGFARHVAEALAPLLAEHPSLRLTVLVDDALVDLIDARVDLALRGGRLPDSAWVARRLCDFDFVICAAPAYLAGFGEVREPAQAATAQWIATPRDDTPWPLLLRGPGGQETRLSIAPRLVSNNQLTVQQLCAAGLGLALCVRADVDEWLRSGRLVTVLPDWVPPSAPIWAVTPQRDGQPAKVRHAIDALQRHLRTVPGMRP